LHFNRHQAEDLCRRKKKKKKKKKKKEKKSFGQSKSLIAHGRASAAAQCYPFVSNRLSVTSTQTDSNPVRLPYSRRSNIKTKRHASIAMRRLHLLKSLFLMLGLDIMYIWDSNCNQLGDASSV